MLSGAWAHVRQVVKPQVALKGSPCGDITELFRAVVKLVGEELWVKAAAAWLCHLRMLKDSKAVLLLGRCGPAH